MNKLRMIVSMVVASCMAACAQNKTLNMEQQETTAVVVYFSATGTTRSEAELIAKVENAPLVEILPMQPYTAADLNWNNKKSRSSIEMGDNNSRPSVEPVDVAFANYDTIFLGYPIWWDLAPRVINTFIENNGLTGKTVIPFATSGGSGIENSVRQLKRQYPDIEWGKGRLLNGASERAVKNWIESLGK